jgi:erythronate-4-phosphate dehydrogenase
MPFAEEAFGTLGAVVVREGRAIGPADVRDAELLAVRSTTRIDRRLLEGSAVRFVGTATIGTDHMDTGYLDEAGIRWCYAPGCNANSVAEYVVCALLCLAARHGLSLDGRTLGIVGVGNVGGRVERKAAALGLRVLRNDPPRARTEPDAAGTFVTLDALLAESDIVTLHVPLTRAGPDATVRMADADFFARMKRGAIFVNSARGAVMDTDALLSALAKGSVGHAVIDTWEHEPDIRDDLLQRIDLGTPHIAGYSFDGKVMGTVMVYREACRFLGVPPRWQPDGRLPAPPVPSVTADARARAWETALWEVVRRVYDIEADDRRLRRVPEKETIPEHFDRLRREYPARREFRYTRVACGPLPPDLVPRIRGLGFGVSSVP